MGLISPGSGVRVPPGAHTGVLAEWLRRLIRNQLGAFPREFESLRRRLYIFIFWDHFLSYSEPSTTAADDRRHLGRVVKAVDSKSTGLRPHRFESGRCRLQIFLVVIFVCRRATGRDKFTFCAVSAAAPRWPSLAAQTGRVSPCWRN